MSLRLLSYNIRFGGIGREKQLATVINYCQPDLVLLQEATSPDVVDHLASSCGMRTSASIRGQSVAFLSNIEIAGYAWHPIRFGRRMYLEVVLGRANTQIFGVHLSAIHSNITEQRRSFESRSLLKQVRQNQPGFHLVMGDFNTLAPGERLDVNRLPPRLRAIVWLTGGTIRWTTIRHMLDSGYTDGYRVFHKDDEGFTFPTWDPHVRLDYAFIPNASVSRLTRCEVVRDAPGLRDASDHFPLLSELTES